MKIFKILFALSLIFFIWITVHSQTKLKPGFDPNEYKQLLEITARQADTPWTNVSLPYPEGCSMVYRSDTLGLLNRWDMWMRDDTVGIISIRGTVVENESWLEDFYAAMVPASGYLTLGKNNIFEYKLAEDTNAFVHTGFLLGTAYLAPIIVEKINEYYSKGVKEYIIMGHSQGGAITYLLTSYFHYLPQGVIPGDVHFKTYSSAPPKPGNLFYAYDYEYLTRGGWTFRIVNTMDWVPNMPITVQTEFDYNKNNPIASVDSMAPNLNLIERIVIGLMERSMLGSLNDARDELIKYLGYKTYPQVKKKLTGFKEPKYANTMYYMTCGTPVILKPTPEYFEKFTYQKGFAGMFTNHMAGAYYYLLTEEYLK